MFLWVLYISPQIIFMSWAQNKLRMTFQLVGLAIDAIMHFCVAYHESEQPTRFLKTKQATTELGVSGWGGGVTHHMHIISTTRLFLIIQG